MPTPIKIIIGKSVLSAELFDSPCAGQIINRLPIEASPDEWGDEFYFSIPVETPLDETATTKVKAGDIGFSLADPHGNAAWHFRQLQPTPDHMVALCSSADARIVCRETSPLQWERVVEVRTTRASKISPLSPTPPS